MPLDLVAGELVAAVTVGVVAVGVCAVVTAVVGLLVPGFQPVPTVGALEAVAELSIAAVSLEVAVAVAAVGATVTLDAAVSVVATTVCAARTGLAGLSACKPRHTKKPPPPSAPTITNPNSIASAPPYDVLGALAEGEVVVGPPVCRCGSLLRGALTGAAAAAGAAEAEAAGTEAALGLMPGLMPGPLERPKGSAFVLAASLPASVEIAGGPAGLG